MPKAKKNNYQDWTVPNEDGPSKGGLGPRLVHEDPSLAPPRDDPGLKKGLGYGLDEEIEVDVREMVRKYEDHDLGELADGPERQVPAIKPNIKTDQLDNQYHQELEENLGPSFHHEESHEVRDEEQYENPAFQPEDDLQEPEKFHHEDPPPGNRMSHNHIQRQHSDALPAQPAYEFDAAAAREASKNQWSAERPGAPSVNERRPLDTMPAVPAREMTAARCDRKSGGDYRSRKASLPPVPGYNGGDDIAAQKKKAAAEGADRRGWKSRARGNGMVDYVVSKTGSKANRTVVILIASGLLAIVIAILFMIIYFSTGNKALPTVTIQPTDARPTDTGGSIVIVGVNLDATVRLSNRAFIPQYNNDLSPQYKSLADNFTNSMDDVFYGSDLGDVYNGTHVNGFSSGSVIVDFVIRLLSPPMTAPGDMTTPAGSIEDRLKKVEEDVQAAVQAVIEDAADDGGLDELGVDATSFVVTDVGVDVRVITEAPTTSSPPETTLRPTTQGPTTVIPTTEIPTTQRPTTEIPTTQRPTTEIPTTRTPDTTPPSIDCPESEVFYLANGEFSANVTWPPIDATDDSGQVTVTTDMSEGLWDTGDYTVVATATDPAGNSADCSFNITIKARTCPAGWLRRSNSCYRLAWSDPVPYAQALQLCSELGSFPFIPNVRAEFDFVVEFLGEADLGIQTIWLGCDDTNMDGKFLCLDGKRILLHNPWWAPGQPDSYETENCLVLFLGAMNLHDYPCTLANPNTLCERDAE
eukprot:XP_790721.3 PREDICTED: uncharacterized protein LOC585818 isoform X2 [Strongylocentrotus purpuratus]